MAEQSIATPSISEDEKLWGFLAWLLSIVGAVLAMVLKPGYRYAKYWAYLSLSFFILIIIASVISMVLAIIPFVGWVLAGLISIGLVVVWIIGIIKSLQPTWWKPPLVYDIAKAIGIERI
ncbi:MAG: DUF4870 domain-containing protein [Ignisphaera sp.]|uniref:DUF4870 domain-containing protein n=1 Tax=Ignisphaera aggregans TaxID=334771 RepID=A0A7J3JRM3_9CREN